jgi:hypothetical protein
MSLRWREDAHLRGESGKRFRRRAYLPGTVTQVGALQTAPILIAVVTAFLVIEGVKYLRRKRNRSPEGQ